MSIPISCNKCKKFLKGHRVNEHVNVSEDGRYLCDECCGKEIMVVEKTQEPLYTKDLDFKAMRKLCSMAGLDVVFEDTEYLRKMGLFAYTKEIGNTIYMPDSDDYISEITTNKNEATVLGHEIGHHILDNFGFYSNGIEDNPVLANLIETECDKIGIILSQLSKLIVKNEKKKIIMQYLNSKASKTVKVVTIICYGNKNNIDADYTLSNGVALLSEHWNEQIYSNGFDIMIRGYTGKIYEPIYYDKENQELLLGFGEI
jgi:hypothetical protein